MVIMILGLETIMEMDGDMTHFLTTHFMADLIILIALTVWVLV